MRPKRDLPDFARPPRGWLYGVVLTILIFWFAGVLWQSFLERESPAKVVGGCIMLVATALNAQQALTNDDYKTSKWTRAASILLLVGVIVFVVGSHL